MMTSLVLRLPPLLADAVDYMALELFVNPYGLRALVREWLLNFRHRPLDALSGPTIASLIRKLAIEVTRCDLAIFQFHTENQTRDWKMRLFEDHFDLGISRHFAMAAELNAVVNGVLCLVTPCPGSQGAGETDQKNAFELVGNYGLRRELRLEKFIGNDLLWRRFNRPFAVALVCDEAIATWKRSNVIEEDERLLMDLTDDLVAALKAAAEATPRDNEKKMYQFLAQICQQNNKDIDMLAKRMESAVEELCKKSRRHLKQQIDLKFNNSE
jgi:hypothetical protein